MERELGLSYPTVRARVEALLRALGLGDDAAVEDLPPESTPRDSAGDAMAAQDVAAARRGVLERLARGDIDAVSAAAELRTLGG